jgi:type II secretory pathway component PulF
LAVFAYRAFSPSGGMAASQTGIVAADTPRAARDTLRQRGLAVEAISEVHPKPVRRRIGSGRDSRKVAAFARELSTLLAVGTPLTDALETIALQHRGSFRSTVMLIKEEVLAGSSLNQAMGRQPAVFDELCLNLVEVGEDSGTLDLALERLAQFKERSQQFKGKIGTALMYPCIVLVTAVAVSIFLMTYVVPSILQPLLEQGRTLPLPTRIVKGASDFLISYGWMVGLAGFILIAAWAALLKTHRGRFAWDSLLLRMPILGDLLRKVAVVKIAVVMGTLLQSGVVFVRAIQIARKTTRNVVLKDALARCDAAVSAGGEIASALEGTAAFGPLVVQVFSVGQQSGRLEEMLQRLAKDYDDQVAAAAQRLTAVLEPILILFLAGIVLTIALATMLPILEAGDVLG